jgi:outer membrane protein OmpA-like peptidoglycan-associated protein
MKRDDATAFRRSTLLACAIFAALSVVLAACQTEQPAPREVPAVARPAPAAPQRRTPAPAPSVPQTVISAGPLKPADVDKYMDGLESDLRHRLRGIAVARKGETIVVALSDALLFDAASLKPSGGALLAAVALSLRRFDHTLVQVNGYTDTKADAASALALSQKHAELVAAALAEESVEPARLSAQGMGAANLRIATGQGVAEARNRRVELRISAKLG